jgi:hypothetical protein
MTTIFLVRCACSILLFVGVGFIHNIASSIETLTGELMELAIYQSNHLTQTNRAWEDMTADLEKLEEEQQ